MDWIIMQNRIINNRNIVQNQIIPLAVLIYEKLQIASTIAIKYQMISWKMSIFQVPGVYKIYIHGIH